MRYAEDSRNATSNELLRMAPPTYPVTSPAANYSWPVYDFILKSSEAPLLISQVQHLLVQIQYTGNNTLALVGLEPKSLRPLWSTKGIPMSLNSQITGPHDDIITLYYPPDALHGPPYKTSIVGYSAVHGHCLWQVRQPLKLEL